MTKKIAKVGPQPITFDNPNSKNRQLLYVCIVCGETYSTNKLVGHFTKNHKEGSYSSIKDKEAMKLKTGEAPIEASGYLKMVLDRERETDYKLKLLETKMTLYEFISP